MAAARRLSGWGVKVSVIHPFDSMKDTPSLQMRSLKRLPVRILPYSHLDQHPVILQTLNQADLILDALIGYD